MPKLSRIPFKPLKGTPEVFKEWNDSGYYFSNEGRCKWQDKNGKWWEEIGTKAQRKKHGYFYNVVTVNGKQVVKSRCVWEAFYGKIPDGYFITKKMPKGKRTNLTIQLYSNRDDLAVLKLTNVRTNMKTGRLITEKKILDRETGHVYNSAKELAACIGKKPTTLISLMYYYRKKGREQDCRYQYV